MGVRLKAETSVNGSYKDQVFYPDRIRPNKRGHLEVKIIPTPGLGDTSYLVNQDGVGVVIDPQRDVDRFEQAIAEAAVEVAFVIETHLHNDYVSGGRDLAGRTGADLVLPAGAGAAFPYLPAFHLEDLEAGSMAIRPIHTPGHTPEHMSYVLMLDGEYQAVFSGGSLRVGTAGRTDLLGKDRAPGLARLQYGSVHRLAGLPDHTLLYPTHGAGSFCAASSTGRSYSTIGQERDTNPVLTYPDMEAFVQGQLNALPAYPKYYAHMGPINLMGPSPISNASLPILDPTDLPDEAAVIDIRPRQSFADGHLPGSIGLEMSPQVAVWAGWLIPFNARVVIVAEPDQDIDEAARQFRRIGFDDLAGVVYGLSDYHLPLNSYRTRTVSDLAQALAEGADIRVIDVRSPEEWNAGHIRGSVNEYVPDLVSHLPDNMDGDGATWVICGTGYRATAAAGLLELQGISPLVVERGGVPDVLSLIEAG